MNKHKRLLSLLLAVVMVIGMVPLTAVAQDGETQPAVASCEYCKVDLVEGALHSVGCPTTCTCDPKPAEGEAHAVGCPLNLTPAASSEDGNTTASTGASSETTAAPSTEAPTTESTAAPSTEPPLCDKCEAKKGEDGETIVHEETCPTLCKCEAVIEGYHSNMECPFYVEPAEPTIETTGATEPTEVTEPFEPVDTVKLADGTVVKADGIPSNSALVVEEASSEKAAVAVDLAVMEGYTIPKRRGSSESLLKSFEISVDQNGEEWQPGHKETVELEMDLDVSWMNAHTYLFVIHILDTVEAIEHAENKYLHFDKNLKELYPEECAAAEEAGFPENTFVYTIMSPDNGDVSVNQSGKITIETSSFSTYAVVAFNVDTPVYMSTTPESGLVMDKSATFDNAADSGVITLSTYYKGAIESTPTDVVLVIDHSGSMWSAVDPDGGQMSFSELNTEKGAREGYYVAFNKTTANTAHLVRYESGKWQISRNFSTTHTTTNKNGKFLGFINATLGNNRDWKDISNTGNYIFCVSISGALHDALNIFMDEMKNAVNCRIALVTFSGTTDKISASDLNANDDYIGSGIFVDGKLKWDSSALNKQGIVYRNAFEDPTTTAGYDVLTNTIDAINTDYGNTATAMGLLYARRLFNEGGRTGAQKVAIVFTDGIPNPSHINTRDSESCKCGRDGNSVVNNCPYHEVVVKDGSTYYRSTYVDQANKLKTNNKATVYSIGPTSGNQGLNVLQNIASSNNHVYAAEADRLSAVFKEIAGVIVSSSQNLNKDTAVVDTMSHSFQLPDGIQPSDVEVFTAQHIGNETFAQPVKFNDAKIVINENNNTVKVSNFDYAEESVWSAGDNHNGKKLIIKVPYTTVPGFLGGEHVPTNDATSGIYNGTFAVDTFNEPEVDVWLKTVEPNSQVKNIYISQTASIPDVANIGSYILGNTPFEIDGVRNGYVDITYTVKDKTTGKSISLTIPAGTKSPESIVAQWAGELDAYPELINDTEYEVTCTISSSAEGTDHNASDPNYQEKAGKQDVEILVYKPIITFNDSAIELGDTPDYATENGGTSVVWKHGEDETNNMATRYAPTLVYDYDPVAAAFTDDTPVKVTVTSKQDLTNSVPADMDITQYVTFFRDACDYQDCDHKTETEVSAADNDRINFVVHLKSFNLKIKKEGADLDLDPNTSFIFRVTGENFSMDVVINGNGEAVIENLPAGVYSVTELTDWSWRYEPEDAEQDASAADAVNGTTTVKFVNHRDKTQWLDGEAYVKNAFTGSTTNS